MRDAVTDAKWSARIAIAAIGGAALLTVQAPAAAARPDTLVPADIRALLQAGEGPRALHQLEAAHRDDPGNPVTTRTLLRLYGAIGDDEALRALARRTLETAGDDAVARALADDANPFLPEWESEEAYVRLGMEKIGGEHWLESAEIFDEILARNTHSAVALNNLGWARARLGFFDTAIPCFRRAHALDPGMARVAANLAWAIEHSTARRPPPPLRLP